MCSDSDAISFAFVQIWDVIVDLPRSFLSFSLCITIACRRHLQKVVDSI